jgi:Carboxypeptidase regulatory-like domain/TonB dependent receptor
MKFFMKPILMIGFASAGLLAQTVQINGAVRDASGLAVPGAEVTVTQTDTGFTRMAQSAADGAYLLLDLPIGPYRLEVKKAGFSTYVQAGIILQVDTNPTIDVVLKVGSLSEQVVVEAAAGMVETQSTGVGQVINQQQVVDLPLNGRDATQLIFLSGASTTGPNGQINTTKNYQNETIIALAGPGVSGISYMLDGGTHNDPFNSLNLPFPFPDTLQEFKVETSALPAQYGYHSAGAVNAVTKSGTNEIHGDAFEFVRNTDFNGRDFLATTGDGVKRNQFGGTIGGPIRKNKLFFFLGYQQTILRSAPANSVAYLPTLQMLAGNFTTAASPACNSNRQITLKAPFVNNMVAPSLLNASALKAMTTYFPTPPDQACGRIVYSAVSDSTEYMGIAKIDYQISAKHTLFGHYFAPHEASPPSQGNAAATLQTILSSVVAAGTDDLVQSGVIGDTYVFGPTTINSFRATVTRTAVRKYVAPQFTPADVGVNITALQPYGMYTDVVNYFQNGGLADTGSFITTHQLADDFSLIRGTHQLGFGANWIRPDQDGHYATYAAGFFTFNGQTTGLANANFLLGDAASYTQNNLQQDIERHDYIGLYAQDSWKIKRNLSLNYGLRWEPYMGPQMIKGYVSHFSQADFNAGVHSTVYPNGPVGTLFPGDPGFNTNDRPSNIAWKDFAPRIGMVWDPKGDGKMTVRASWGIFYDLPYTIQFYDYATGPPWGGGITLTQPPGGYSNPWLGFPGGNPYPLQLSSSYQFPNSGTYLTTPLNLHPTYVEQWNLSLQRQISPNWLVSASYVGNDAVHLWSGRALDPAVYFAGTCAAGQYGLTAPGPCSTTGNVAARRILTLENPSQGPLYGAVSLVDDGGTGSYNALLLSFNHRLANHFTMLGVYTYAHCIADPISQYLGGSYTNPADRRQDRGNCVGGEDQRHNIQFSMVAESPKYSQRVLEIIAGNWRLAATANIRTGAAYTVTTGISENLTGLGGDRPNQVLADPYCHPKTVSCWVNPAAFSYPATGTYGNVGVGTLFGPGYFGINLGLFRGFRVRERQTIEIRAEAFNLENRINLGSPVATLSSSTFGQINAEPAGNGAVAAPGYGPRVMQFSIKYIF